MSRRNEDFDNAFWDQEVVERLSSEATLLYIWSWTNQRCGMAGIYEASPRVVAESKLTPDQIDVAFELLEDENMAFYRDRVIWVRARVKRLRTKTVQIAKSIAHDVEKISPANPLRDMWLRTYGQSGWLQGALNERQLTVGGGSLDPHEIISPEPKTVSLPGTSTEVPLQGLSSKEGFQGGGMLDARAKPKAVNPDSLPAEFPDSLTDAVETALTLLIRVQAERGGNVPTRRGVGLAVQAYPDRDHAAVAGELEHWATAGTGSRKPVRDWTATYRRFLANAVAGSPLRAGKVTLAPKEDFLAALSGRSRT